MSDTYNEIKIYGAKPTESIISQINSIFGASCIFFEIDSVISHKQDTLRNVTIIEYEKLQHLCKDIGAILLTSQIDESLQHSKKTLCFPDGRVMVLDVISDKLEDHQKDTAVFDMFFVNNGVTKDANKKTMLPNKGKKEHDRNPF
jgi:hypothetical protein